MTTEEDFQKKLDANPDDWQTRLVFADWLEEQGDARAKGYMALGHNRVEPGYRTDPCYRNIDFAILSSELPRPFPSKIYKCGLPGDWFWLMITLEKNPGDDISWWPPVNGQTRKQVEDMAAIAFSKLSKSRQEELLKNSFE